MSGMGSLPLAALIGGGAKLGTAAIQARQPIIPGVSTPQMGNAGLGGALAGGLGPGILAGMLGKAPQAQARSADSTDQVSQDINIPGQGQSSQGGTDPQLKRLMLLQQLGVL